MSFPARVTFGDLQRLPAADRDQLAGDAVLLLVNDLRVALATLAQLDGAVQRILIASSAQSPEVIWQLGRQAGCTVVVTDLPLSDLPAGWQSVRVAWERPLAGRPADHQGSEESTRWLLSTTGTTGLPKIVGHELESLTRTIRQEMLADTDVRWGMLYDYTRYAGLQVVLQALLSGATIIAPDAADGLEDQIDELVVGGCTHLSATPTLWRKILMTDVVGRLNLRQVTLGGEIADQRLLNALRVQFPAARVTHIYASTESGVGFSVSDGLAGFPVDYLAQPRNGIEMRVVGDRLQVKNTRVDGSYVGSQIHFADPAGFVDTGDIVEQRGSRFYFLGRANGQINVGGNKVHPEQVEDVLLQHHAVAAARVTARQSSFTGALVVAEVVIRRNGSDERSVRAELLKFCREHLSRHQVPAVVQCVEEIEINAGGKVTR
ncbi:MAG: AMP-binding protein [Pirellulales bacterium]